MIRGEDLQNFTLMGQVVQNSSSKYRQCGIFGLIIDTNSHKSNDIEHGHLYIVSCVVQCITIDKDKQIITERLIMRQTVYATKLGIRFMDQ